MAGGRGRANAGKAFVVAETAVSDVYSEEEEEEEEEARLADSLAVRGKREKLDVVDRVSRRSLFNSRVAPNIGSIGKGSRIFADLRDQGERERKERDDLNHFALHLSLSLSLALSFFSICPSLTDVLDHCA